MIEFFLSDSSKAIDFQFWCLPPIISALAIKRIKPNGSMCHFLTSSDSSSMSQIKQGGKKIDRMRIGEKKISFEAGREFNNGTEITLELSKPTDRFFCL